MTNEGQASGPRSTTSTRSSRIAETNTDVDEAIHAVKDNADAIFTWDYEKGARPALNKLYEKAKTSQWNGETDLDWSIDVDPEQVVRRSRTELGEAVGEYRRPSRHPRSRTWGDKEWVRVRRRVAELAPQPVHARRAGRAAVHRQDRRDRAVDRRQVLRRHPGDGRGPPRRGVRQVPRHEARRALPDQRRTCRCCSTTSSTTAAGT